MIEVFDEKLKNLEKRIFGNADVSGEFPSVRIVFKRLKMIGF